LLELLKSATDFRSNSLFSSFLILFWFVQIKAELGELFYYSVIIQFSSLMHHQLILSG
jgi:hypothetical protein